MRQFILGVIVSAIVATCLVFGIIAIQTHMKAVSERKALCDMYLRDLRTDNYHNADQLEAHYQNIGNANRYCRYDLHK